MRGSLHFVFFNLSPQPPSVPRTVSFQTPHHPSLQGRRHSSTYAYSMRITTPEAASTMRPPSASDPLATPLTIDSLRFVSFQRKPLLCTRSSSARERRVPFRSKPLLHPTPSPPALRLSLLPLTSPSPALPFAAPPRPLRLVPPSRFSSPTSWTILETRGPLRLTFPLSSQPLTRALGCRGPRWRWRKVLAQATSSASPLGRSGRLRSQSAAPTAAGRCEFKCRSCQGLFAVQQRRFVGFRPSPVRVGRLRLSSRRLTSSGTNGGG